MNAEIIVFLGYFVILFFVGLIFFFNGSNKNQSDYFLGGRSMGPWVTAMSAQASDMSAWLLMGLPGSILAFGFGQIWIGIGLALGTAANWIFCAKRLRKLSVAANDAITVPQYLTNRFVSQKKTLQVICAVIFLIAFTVYVASALVAGTSVFVSLFPDISQSTAMLIYTLIIIGYTFLGGFKAVCWTDFFQGILMLIALLAVPIIVRATQTLDVSALQTVYQYTDASGAVVTCDFGAGLFSASWKDIVSGLGWGLGYFGMPHILIHFMAAEDENKLKISRRVGTVWVVISLSVAVVIGIIGYSMAKAGALAMPGTEAEAENMIVNSAALISTHGALAAIVAGIIIAGILAATMSTADAQLLAAASGVTHNILTDVFGIKLSDKKTMTIARVTVVGVAILGVIFASDPNSSIFRVVSFAWAGFGATFGPVMLFGLFWKRCNKWGAMSGMIVGGVMVFVWKYLIAPLGGIFAIYELLPAFVISAIVIVVVSLLTPAPEKEIVEEFESVGK